MIKRDLYMKQIRPYINKPFVKILTGIRRSGKSTILSLLREELVACGVAPENIIHINFENLDFADIGDAKELHNFIKERMTTREKHYILLDEIQEVKSWEKAVNSFLAAGNADIYITGSNSKLLSSEFVTYLAGRYVEISVNTLSFQEYLTFVEARTGKTPENIREALWNYIQLGGFPAIHLAEYERDAAYKIINDIYSSAILRDTVQRHNIRNIDLLERIVKFVFDNIGNTFSAKKVSDYFKSQQRKADLNTVYNYLNALESAYIIKRISRYDIKGKEHLQINEKYYIGDPALIYAVMGYKPRLISGVLENIVLLELERRGYHVSIGKLDAKEVDFAAERWDEKVYIQVAYILNDNNETIDREFGPLNDIPDHYPKYVVTMDEHWEGNIDGIKHVHLADFLRMENY